MNPKRAKLLEAESEKISDFFPTLSLRLEKEDVALIEGPLEIVDNIAYSIRIFVPPDYPRYEPLLVCDPREIPWNIDRHVSEKNGVACLCTPSETRILWPPGNDLSDFIEKLVKPFFIGQFYFDTHGRWPPTGERSHGRAGVLETFHELLADVENLNESKIRAFLRLLARKNHPKGHETCPCGNGKKLRHCHRELLQKLRKSIDPRHALLDFEEAFGRGPKHT
ncbi:MAG: hypothetical protein AAGA96_19685 [Verrucomicrobiota bacterium]